jgi:uncharacterized lipoprotein YajG
MKVRREILNLLITSSHVFLFAGCKDARSDEHRAPPAITAAYDSVWPTMLNAGK